MGRKYSTVTYIHAAVTEYCDKHVCISVCLSALEDISKTIRAIFNKFLCMLPIAVARSSSGRVTKYQGVKEAWSGDVSHLNFGGHQPHF